MQLQSYSFRLGAEIMQTAGFLALREEFQQVFQNVNVPQLDPPQIRVRDNRTYTFTTNQAGLNANIDQAFVALGWERKPFIDAQRRTRVQSDYGKGRVLVEVQFGNMSRWYADVFKFQLAYSLGTIDVGISVVPTQAFAITMDENIAYFERARREIELARMSVTMPIWLVGIEP